MSQVSKVAGSASTTHALGGDGGRRLAIGLLLLVVWYLVARSGLVGDYGGHLATAIAYNTIAVLSISVLAGAAGMAAARRSSAAMEDCSGNRPE